MKILSTLFCAALLAGALPLAAQTSGGGRSEDNVLFPQPTPLPFYVGVDAGYGWWDGNTSFTVTDQSLPCISFSVGDGRGPVFGARAFYSVLNPHLFFIPRLRYEVRNSSYISPLPEEPTRDRADSVVMIQQEGQVDASLAALVGDLSVGWEFFGTGGYLFGGIGYNIQLGGTFDYTERILNPEGIVYGDSRTREHTLLRSTPFPTYESNSFDLRIGAGWLVRTGSVYLNPEFTYRIPLSSSLAPPEEMKQRGLIVTLGVLYRLR